MVYIECPAFNCSSDAGIRNAGFVPSESATTVCGKTIFKWWLDNEGLRRIFRSACRNCFRHRIVVSVAGQLHVAEAGEQRREDEQVQQRRCDQSAEDHEGQWVFDFLAGLVSRDDERNQSEASSGLPW